MKFHLGHLLGLSAVILAITAAFFSVTGLGQLFAGASLAVIIMASALEFSKIIIATFLHRYWVDLSKILKTYLTIGLIILVAITSAGIYGFLSSAYQTTATQLEAHDAQIGLVDNKILLVQGKIDNNNKLIDSKLERYDNLMNLRETQETRLDSMINRRYFSNAEATRNEIVKASTEMERLQGDVDVINSENNKLNDSIGKFQLGILEMKTSSTVAGEVGPLKYMAELTGQSMDVIVNYFTLLLIFVFDPLAISLVIATNWIFERKRREKEEKLNGDTKEPEEDHIESETEVENVVDTDEPGGSTEGKWVCVNDENNEPVGIVFEEVKSYDEPAVIFDEDNYPTNDEPGGSTEGRWVYVNGEDKEPEGIDFEEVKSYDEPAVIFDEDNYPTNDDYKESEDLDFVGQYDEYDVELEDEVDVNDIEVVDAEEVKIEEPAPTKTKLSFEEIEKVGPYSKGERGFSTKIPEPKPSTERRIGTNKILKDGHQAVYKNNKRSDD